MHARARTHTHIHTRKCCTAHLLVREARLLHLRHLLWILPQPMRRRPAWRRPLTGSQAEQGAPLQGGK